MSLRTDTGVGYLSGIFETTCRYRRFANEQSAYFRYLGQNLQNAHFIYFHIGVQRQYTLTSPPQIDVEAGVGCNAYIPRIAEAFDVSLDPSFVAFVPIGGRHAQHLWRLVNGLGIPCLTLLDFDLGRHNAGMGRVKNAVTWLSEVGYTFDPTVVLPTNDQLLPNTVSDWTKWLRNIGVYYSTYLDLDMMMIQAFPNAYLAKRALDPAKDNPAKIAEAVFGDKGPGNTDLGRINATFTDQDLFTYKNLFKSSSKPASHYKGLAALDNEEIKTNCPEPLKALIVAAKTILAPPPPPPPPAKEEVEE
jgi:putative ATP-dependent endonuclease of OLD family